MSLGGVIPPIFAPVFGTSATTLRALQGFATNTTNVSVVNALPGLVGSARANDGIGTSATTLQNLTTVAYAAGPYSISSNTLGGIVGSAEGGMLAPNYALSNTYLQNLATFGISLVGMTGVSTNVMPGLRGFSTNTSGAYGSGDVLGPLATLAFDSTAASQAFAIVENVEHSRLVAFGHRTYIDRGFDGVQPSPTFIGRGGARSVEDLPASTLSAHGSTTILGHSTANLPVGTLSAHGVVSLLGHARLTQPLPTLIARSGGISIGDLPNVCSFESSGFTGATSATGTTTSDGLLPVGTLLASGTTGIVGRADGTLPAMRAATSGVLIATLPRGTFVGHGFTEVTVEYEAYSITLITDVQGNNATATSRYTNYPFDQILRFGNTYYGVAADGLYALDGDDFDGTPIVSTVVTGETDHGSSALKRAVSLYLGGRMGADMNISVTSAELDTNTYTFRPRKTGAGTFRAVFGKGIRAQYWAYQFTNTAGEDFTLDGMAPEIDVLRRTL